MFAINENGFAIGGRARKFQAAKIGHALDDVRLILCIEGQAMVEEGKRAWQKGMDLLLSIKGEPVVEKELNAIWARKDATEFEKEAIERVTATRFKAELESDIAQVTTKISKRKKDKPALPQNQDMPEDIVANPLEAAKILGTDADKI